MAKVSIQNFFSSLTQQYQSIFVIGLGATPLQLGILSSAGGVAGALVATPAGWLADKRGVKAVMVLGMIPMILGAFLFAISMNWLIALPAVVVAMLALRIEMTVCPMVCGSCLKSGERAMGMQFCDTLSAIPRLISPIIAAAIVTNFGGISVEGTRPLLHSVSRLFSSPSNHLEILQKSKNTRQNEGRVRRRHSRYL